MAFYEPLRVNYHCRAMDALRLLARLIARAYRCDTGASATAEEQPHPDEDIESPEEEDDERTKTSPT